MTLPVLVRGVGSHNGGAELLLRASSLWLEAAGFQAVADVRRTDRKLRADWQVGGYFGLERVGSSGSLGFVPRRVAEAAGVVGHAHVSAVLDASGFALGDQWPSHHLENTLKSHRRWRDRGVPIVYLAQAFGPFTDRPSANLTRLLLETVDLVFARDPQSFSSVVELLGRSDRVRLSPDITIPLAVQARSSVARSRAVAIVPNINLVERSSSRDPLAAYAQVLTEIAAGLNNRGYDPFILIHSKHGDPDVAQACRMVAPALPVVVPRDGLEAKRVLASCGAVIAGRYHAIVSALSSGVPAVAHSWSHKYQALLDDFDCSEMMADAFDAKDTLLRVDTAMSDDTLVPRLDAATRRLSQLVHDAWADVDAVLRRADGRSLPI